jgi:hypothetical protein
VKDNFDFKSNQNPFSESSKSQMGIPVYTQLPCMVMLHAKYAKQLQGQDIQPYVGQKKGSKM